jgi:hypothetical protein
MHKTCFLFLLLLGFYNTGHAVDKFDIQVCEAQAGEAKKIECYRGLQLDASCNNKDISKQLACFRESAENAVSFEKEGWKHSGMLGKMDLVLIHKNKEMNQSIYRDAIKSVCAGKNWCKVLFWSNPGLIPKRFPMNDAQVKGQTASWVYNGNNGYREMLWACRIVDDPNQCFSN